MIAIVAVDRNWGIGYKGKLLVTLPEDQKGVFRRYTRGNTVVYGRKTLETFPGLRPLPDRRNIVLSRNEELEMDGAVVLHSVAQLREYIHRHMEEVIYVIGGAEVYKELLPYCDKAVVTRIDAEFKADAFFENLDESEDWVEIDRTDPIRSVKGYSFSVIRYRNINPKRNCAYRTIQ
ncbi:MAG: dihydrofolate reductase [Clostridiales bacterium]|nr:dihydrofolate reductase [Clostridiales bacterium]